MRLDADAQRSVAQRDTYFPQELVAQGRRAHAQAFRTRRPDRQFVAGKCLRRQKEGKMARMTIKLKYDVIRRLHCIHELADGMDDGWALIDIQHQIEELLERAAILLPPAD